METDFWSKSANVIAGIRGIAFVEVMQGLYRARLIAGWRNWRSRSRRAFFLKPRQ
jgi:hypothetical protein